MKNIGQVGSTFTNGHVNTPVFIGHTPISSFSGQMGSTFTGVIPTGGSHFGGSDSVGFD